MLIDDRERFIAFDLFPWFRESAIGPLTRVELQSPGHLHWPELDIDLAIESIDHPERFPLVSQVGAKTVRARAAPPARPRSSRARERSRAVTR